MEYDTRRRQHSLTAWAAKENKLQNSPTNADFVNAKCYYWLYGANVGILREPVPPLVPTGLLDSLRLYRLRTDAKFSFPLGKATSPAAVPVRPFLPEIASLTSLISSSNVDAVVYLPWPGFVVGGSIPFERWGLNFRWTWRQKHGSKGLWGLRKAGSMMPCS